MRESNLLDIIHDVTHQIPEQLVVLPTDRNASHKRPWWRQGALPQSNPFGALGLAYCVHCKQEVDVDTEAHHEGTVYVWRQRCLRCGIQCNFGVYQNIPLLQTPALLNMSLEWVFEPGKDRR